MNRKILHVDLDAFFCAVEAQLEPSLREKPFAVGGRPDQRGVVASASYPARAYGVRSAMPMGQALRLCPDLIVVPARHAIYRQHSNQVMDFLRQNSPLMEQISIDESFLDFSQDRRPVGEIARTLKDELRTTFQLPTSWGVSTNKLVAKIATQMGKPDGLVVVPEGREAEFLAPLPVEMLWGVGPKTQAQLLNLGVHSIGDLATFSASRLKVLFGERGVDMAAHARAMDERPVQESREPKSVSSERTFARDRKDRDQLRQAMLELCADVARRLKKSGLAGRTVKLKMRWPDFTTITRQIRLEQHTDQEREIFSAAWALFEENWSPGKAVRLLGVGLSDLGAPLRQLSLFDAAGQPDHRLAHAIDEIRDRFGPQAVQRGRDLKL